jgi:hypothetical protein
VHRVRDEGVWYLMMSKRARNLFCQMMKWFFPYLICNSISLDEIRSI